MSEQLAYSIRMPAYTMDAARVEYVYSLFGQCAHQEQLSLLERLPVYLCRDFISLLPLELVSMIVAYLDLKDVLNNCLLVSKQWCHILSGCESYWKMQYRKLHNHEAKDLSDDVSLKDLTVVTLKFEKKIQELGLFKQQKTYHYYLPVGVSKHWLYSCKREGISLTYLPKGTVNPSLNFDVENTQLFHDFTVLLWSWSTCNGALFYGSLGIWHYVPYPDVSGVGSRKLKSYLWQDGVHSSSYFKLGGCTECHLVVEAKRSLNSEHQWVLDVITLNDKVEMAERTSLSFNFLPESHSNTDPFLKISCVLLLHYLHTPSDASPTGSSLLEPFCAEHKLLIQIGIGVVIYKLEHAQADTFTLSGPLHILYPSGSSWVDISPVAPSKICISLDHSLVGVFANDALNVWNIRNHSRYSFSISKISGAKEIFFLSVGTLYSVIAFEFSPQRIDFRILSTTTGRQVGQFGLHLIENGRLQPGLSCDWLDCISTHKCEVYVYCSVIAKGMQPTTRVLSNS